MEEQIKLEVVKSESSLKIAISSLNVRIAELSQQKTNHILSGNWEAVVNLTNDINDCNKALDILESLYTEYFG